MAIGQRGTHTRQVAAYLREQSGHRRSLTSSECCSPLHSHSHSHTHMQYNHTHAHTHTHTHKRTHAHTHKRTHAQHTCKRTHARTHAHENSVPTSLQVVGKARFTSLSRGKTRPTPTIGCHLRSPLTALCRRMVPEKMPAKNRACVEPVRAIRYTVDKILVGDRNRSNPKTCDPPMCGHWYQVLVKYLP